MEIKEATKLVAGILNDYLDSYNKDLADRLAYLVANGADEWKPEGGVYVNGVHYERYEDFLTEKYALIKGLFESGTLTKNQAAWSIKRSENTDFRTAWDTVQTWDDSAFKAQQEIADEQFLG
jgi:hypothetical protein